MKAVTIFLLLIFSINSFGQRVDSLKVELMRGEEDSSRVEILHRLSSHYLWNFPDSTLKYVVDGIKLAEKLDMKKRQIELLHILGEALAGKGNFYNALETQLKALELSEKLKDGRLVTWSYCNIGIVYYYAKEYDKALNYFLKAKSNEEMYKKFTRNIATFIGEAYFHLNQLDSAYHYISTAYELDLKEKSHWSVPYFMMAYITEKKNELETSLNHFREGVRIAVPTLDSINGFIGMARVFNKLGVTDSAMYYTRNALALGQRSSLAYTIVEAASLLTEIFKSRGQIDSAYKYQEMLLAAKDSIFSQEKVKAMQNLSFNEQLRQQELAAATIKHKSWIRLYILLTALAIVILIGIFLWRSNINKQKAYNLLQMQKQEIDQEKSKVEKAYAELESAQAQLIQKEKMASLGELTAGIAHEIQNPLNFINNFSEVNTELIDEMEAQLHKQKTEEAIVIANEMKQNLQKITQHGKRADAIVKGMLLHAKKNAGRKELTDINALTDEYLRLSYHGIRAKDKSFHVNYKTQFDETVGTIEIIPQDIGRVLLNLFNNAFYSVNIKKKQSGDGYEPCILVSTFKTKNKIEIHVKDNGVGIQQELIDKIYQPFFSTKPTGQGTGLGLSISYDIIKAHGGQLKVHSREGEFAEFIVQLPEKEKT